ncbi:MAG: DUF2785 domain-containing protein [Halanaerobiales bacterium]|nr:DUF2785 domain-containing protein [Halanaerobiales bacterium]
MEKTVLKQKLKKVVENEYKITDNIDYEYLTNKMLDNIGALDPELRDDLIYMILANWIMDDVYDNQELKQILNICIDDKHLYYKIGKSNDDSVFTRTFSALVLAVLFHKDNEKDYLEKLEFQTTASEVFKYFREEKDLRGYVKEKGWAHAAAHGADILAEIANSKKANKNLLQKLLKAVISKIHIKNYIYFNEEDERIASAVKNAIKNPDLDNESINKWFRELTNFEKIQDRNKYDTLIFNIKNILKSLYFEIMFDQDLNDRYLLLITDSLKDLDQKRF